ncbi:Ctr copper transporter [Acaromyces ingoldii]|uniref:Copper transport protein n=1 Tax=Acaromyces ingoldii TaxID=215250 RepID=A0A316YNW3_9BASI|nr:Ctr copper transporter [Acaromyces ingoldii]PWN91230.1 Ctr copper transporter [Acaromyces ingoldii]
MEHHHGGGGGEHEGMPMPMPGHGDGGHGGAGEMMCAMSMVWNASTSNVCVVFSSWRISGAYSMILSALVLMVLAATLEYVRMRMRDLDARIVLASAAGSAGSARSRGSLGAVGLGSASTMAGLGLGQHRRKASVKGINSSSSNSAGQLSPALGAGSGANSSGSSRTGSDIDDGAPLLPGGGGPSTRSTRRVSPSWSFGSSFRLAVPPLPVAQSTQLMRTLLFGLSLTLSMFLMLVFMTYNAYLIFSVLFGYMVGHYLFNRDIGGPGQLFEEDKGTACH